MSIPRIEIADNTVRIYGLTPQLLGAQPLVGNPKIYELNLIVQIKPK